MRVSGEKKPARAKKASKGSCPQMESPQVRIALARQAFHCAVREQKITWGESVPLLCSLFTGFLEEVGRGAGAQARQGAVLQISRALSVGMNARVLIVEEKNKEQER